MVETIRVDLHCHSDLSDGYFSPELVAEKLSAAGIKFAALVDHRRVDGLERFRQAFARRGGVAITGVELDARLDNVGLHILGYGFDPEKIINTPAMKTEVSAEQAIDNIHQAGGKAFLAHPFQSFETEPELRAALEVLTEQGLDGIEAAYGKYSRAEQEMLTRIADKSELLISGGSDFHGPAADDHIPPGIEMDTKRWKNFRDSLALFEGRKSDDANNISSDAPPAFSYRRFLSRIVLPALLAVGLYIASWFALFLPIVESGLKEREREMIRELTNSAWSILAEYQHEVEAGRMTIEQAQTLAIERIRYMRYGKDDKDYFWITDMTPTMIMHPYRTELEGSDLNKFQDPSGLNPFKQFVEVVKNKQSGYVDYVWQWKDNPNRREPKESFVRAFEPWGWIIGTGVYLEDVEEDLAAITGKLIDVSVIITLLVGALLFYISHSSLRFEKRRQQAERDLRKSHARYEALVSASRDGTLMLFDGKCTFANPTFQRMTGYTSEEIAMLHADDLFEPTENTADEVGTLLEGNEPPEQFEAILKTKNGERLQTLLLPSRVQMYDQTGYIVVTRDIGRSKKIEVALGESRVRFQTLTQNINMGVFRAEAKPDGKIIEANSVACKLFGIASDADQRSVVLKDIFEDPDRAKALFQDLADSNEAHNFTFRPRHRDGASTTLALSASLVRDPSGQPRYLDAIVEDISAREREASEQQRLLEELQTSLLFLNEPVRHFMRELVTCDIKEPVSEAARKMSQQNFSALGVTAGNELVGLVTDHDLRERVVARGLAADRPLREIMTAPLVEIPDTALVYEAFLTMRENRCRHLIVRDTAGNIAGILRNKELARFHAYSPAVLAREISQAKNLRAVADLSRRMPRLIKTLIDSGAQPQNISRTIAAVNDAVLTRIIELTIAELGEPPLPFVFLALGSVGRREQTLASDQDNAILYADPDPQLATDTADYFHKLGQNICEWLDEAGVKKCPGNMMASNPQWNRPLKNWKKLFRHWIMEPNAEELLKFNIFFDFRAQYGDTALENDLQNYIGHVLQNHAPFFLHMARNTLALKQPLGLFGQIRGDSNTADTLNLKESVASIVHFARLYALRHNIRETHTVRRIDAIAQNAHMRPDTHRDIIAAYHSLMTLRFRAQSQKLANNEAPDNMLPLGDLPQVDTSMLKQSLNQIATLHKKINFDFLGGTG